MATVDARSVVRVPKAAEMVAGQLRRQVVLGQLKEGDSLPSESVLMEQFGVSRPTLREAFRILESEGLISIRRGARGGARVLLPNLEVAARNAGLLLQYQGATLADVYETRAELEPAAVAMLAARRTAADIARLKEALAAQDNAQGGVEASVTTDTAFHRLLVDLCGNQTLQVLVGIISHIIERGDRAYGETHDLETQQQLVKIALRAHARLVELIHARKAKEAETFWKKHLTEAAKIVLEGRQTTLVELLRPETARSA